MNKLMLLATVIMAITLRGIETAHKQTLTHDEGISFLAATCHQGTYEQTSQKLAGAWVPAADWKRLWRAETFFCFPQIGSDLAYYDIHPPLYFWLLHIWTWPFGLTWWSSHSLNIFIAGLITLSLYGFAGELLKNEAEAMLVAFSWALSPSIVTISTEARQYDLFTLWTVLFVWQITRATRQARSLSYATIILTTLGLLTHYQFIIVLIGGVLFATYMLRQTEPRRLIILLGNLAIGLCLAILIHPSFYISIQHQQQQQGFILAELPKRLLMVLLSFIDFLYIIIIGFWIAQKSKFPNLKSAIENPSLFFFLWLAGTTIFLYLTFRSPKLAMNVKYLCAAWPFGVFSVAYIWRSAGRFKPLLTLFFYLCPVALTIGSLFSPRYETKAPTLLSQAESVVIDNTKRGILPRIIWHIPDDRPVFVATQEELLKNQTAWLPGLTPRSVYISHLSYGNTAEQSQKILSLIRQQHQTTLVTQNIWDLGYIFSVTDK